MRNAFGYARKHDVIAMNYFNTTPARVLHPFTLDAERRAAFKRCLKDERTVRLKYKH